MAKKKQTKQVTDDNQKEWAEIEESVSNHVNITLEAFRIFGKKNAKDYPKKLAEMGIFHDVAFTSYLLSFYLAVTTLGPGMADRNKDKKPRGKWITIDDFNQMIGAALLASMFNSSLTLSQEEVDRIKSFLQSDIVGSFLYEFADGLITVERARMIAG